MQAEEKEIHDAIEARQIGNANLSQDHFLKALSHGASKSDPRLRDLTHWLFHENVRSEVTAAASSGDLFEVEAGISIALKCKYPDNDQRLNRLIDLRKPLLQKFIFDLACAPDGGALDQRSSTELCDRIERLGVESTGDLSLLAEGDFPGIPPIKVRRVLPLLLKMGERATSKSEAAYSQFMANCPVSAEVAKPVWAEDSYTGTFDNGQPLRGPSPVDMWPHRRVPDVPDAVRGPAEGPRILSGRQCEELRPENDLRQVIDAQARLKWMPWLIVALIAALLTVYIYSQEPQSCLELKFAAKHGDLADVKHALDTGVRADCRDRVGA
jgi:hypothetical protein